MACKLTYKGERYNTRQELVRHLQLEGVLDQLMKTKLASKAHILSSEQIRNKLIELSESSVTLLPNGFYHSGQVYINRDLADSSTPTHEFSHAYNQLLKNERPEFYKEGLRLVEEQGQQYIEFVKQNQPNLEGEALYEEALAQAVGDAGQRLIEKQSGLFQWLQDAWNSIKEMLGLSSYTIDQVRNMSLQDYTNAVATDLLRGESLGQDNNVQEVLNKLEDLQTLDLEEDEVRYPKYEEDDVTDLANLGDGVYLQINKREELPLAGSFEIFITDYNGDILGFIRGNKSEDTVSFNLIHLDENYRGQGIGKKVYKYFLNDYNIKSDSEITADTESLYKSLIKDNYKAVVTKDNRVEIIKYSNKTQNNQKSIPEQFQINATEQELQQIKEQAIANGTFMKAPNGKDTNLTERQWLQVRSKAFKSWFSSIEDNRSIIEENFDNIINKLGISKNCE